ncbi:uncharacterized protein BDR25DRAFT_307156 [Lindgomyces ingoldianus]|uniref:Uncharacterized protein n=1 Tax=Lindgomyces ingoldianus TaxID=673940 RepID=A0ACB6QDF9_9PLEO|nr:uncharacterized protein BDR25DRAFT_307156 [Lindgomyces ingoldianus]KAF2464648.1 hypothetical protein BDR25DRAFT_307156 [Lindgomyces ingoldianus]
MHAARQACRPKHQVLVLKCYPKFQKNNADVKANSSELSYLLYYASTRRSKLQKVGDFLDKRTTADVWKGRTGNVKVSLEILKALIEKCPQNLSLYASSVLRMLRTILKSDDVSIVEESIPTFKSLCAHQDPATLAADQDFIKQYEEIVQLYAQFASKEVVKHNKTPISWPVAIRFRKAGLQALKAVASSESLGSETGRQLAVILPVILLNIYSESGDYLRGLESREQEKEEHEKEKDIRRRQSVSTVRTAEDEEGDPIAASGTTEDADKLAEEEVGIVALQALRNIFIGVNRGQLRLATSAVLKFIGGHAKPHQHFPAHEGSNDSWPATLLAMICRWAPVQDRYTILVGAMETLIRSPIIEDDLERQLVLATVLDYLLSSTINFIGLSVMDVLIGLISHTLLLLQLGGPGTTILPHHSQATPVTSERDVNNPKSSGSQGGAVVELVKEPSHFRVELLNTLQKCMASLSTHVYYTDQISDMVAAILTRLKPSPSSGVSNTAAAIEDPVGAVDAVASSASLHEKTAHVDRFFSFETARLTALEAVKAIIITANTRRPDGSSASVSRGSIGIRVWEGTQWLLRDPSGKVRKAYVDALITWLNLEKKKEDLRVVEDHRKKENDKNGLARRAVSNASAREKSPKRDKNKFLALLHLAVYDNALQFVDSEADFLLLHLLLSTSINKLGVNAVRSGLPMILRLQEDIQNIDNPGAKVRIGSLVHGYLWALSMALDFETSSVGRALHSEISRRNDKGLWVKTIRIPPMPLDRIDVPNSDPVRVSIDAVQAEALKPFDNRSALVDKIAEGYSSLLYSPPSSPPSSPGRSLSMPIIAPQALGPAPQLPSKVKEELMSDWTKDICIASNTKDSSSASMTGSRTGTSAHATQQKNNYLGITIPNGNLDSVNNSPLHTPRRGHSRPPSTAYGLVGRLSSPHRTRSPSATPGSTSSVRSAVRVEDLKRVLSGKEPPRTSYSTRVASHHHHHDSATDSSASDSMVSVHSLSDASFVTAEHPPHPLPQPLSSNSPESPPTPATTLNPRPLTSHPPGAASSSPPSPHSPSTSTSANHAARQHDQAFATHGVPPVPPIPAALREKSASPSPKDSHRPKTAPSSGTVSGNGSISVRKSRALKRGVVGSRSVNEGNGSRPRSDTGVSGSGIVERDGSRGERGRGRGAGTGVVKKPDFSGFLDSIDVDGGEDDEDGYEEDGGLGAKKAPY